MMTSVLKTKCSNNEKRRVGIMKRYHNSRNCVCIRQFALFSLWRLLCKDLMMLSFMITSCFMFFKRILKNFRSSVTISRVNKHFKQLLKGAEKKVKSGMKFQTFKIFNFETNRFTERLKQTRKMRYNADPLLKYKKHRSWDSLTTRKLNKNLFISFLYHPIIRRNYNYWWPTFACF